MRYLLLPISDLPATDEWLTGAEREQLAALRVPKRRDDWRLGRWTAKRALAQVFAAERLERIAIAALESGRPRAFLDGRPTPCMISISHAGGHGLCAIGPAGVALGCDVETVEARAAGFVADYFTASERALVAHGEPARRAELVTLIWSAKESALKALGEGLRLDTRAIDVAIDGGGEAADWRPFLATEIAHERRFSGWWRTHGGLVLTVAGGERIDPPYRLTP